MENNEARSNLVARFVKDKKGNIVITQLPNVPLIGWIVFELLAIMLHSHSLKNRCENLSMAFLFTWAYLEITSGASYFRRLLGVFIMISLLIGYWYKTT